jgi:hypothetical protein
VSTVVAWLPVTSGLVRCAHLSQETQDKITVGNAARVYNFTPADPATIEG